MRIEKVEPVFTRSNCAIATQSYWQHVALLTKMAFFSHIWICMRCSEWELQYSRWNHCRKKRILWENEGALDLTPLFDHKNSTIRKVKLDTPETLPVFWQSLMNCKAALLQSCTTGSDKMYNTGTRKSGNRHLRDCKEGWEAVVGKWHLEYSSCTVSWCYFQEWVESLGLDMFAIHALDKESGSFGICKNLDS